MPKACSDIINKYEGYDRLEFDAKVSSDGLCGIFENTEELLTDDVLKQKECSDMRIIDWKRRRQIEDALISAFSRLDYLITADLRNDKDLLYIISAIRTL